MHEVNVSAEHIDCQCHLWSMSPDYLSAQGVPAGYCGFCQICLAPGHIRHAPAPMPVSGGWCDGCYHKLNLLQQACKWMAICFIPAAMAGLWWLCLLLLLCGMGLMLFQVPVILFITSFADKRGAS